MESQAARAYMHEIECVERRELHVHVKDVIRAAPMIQSPRFQEDFHRHVPLTQHVEVDNDTLFVEVQDDAIHPANARRRMTRHTANGYVVSLQIQTLHIGFELLCMR